MGIEKLVGGQLYKLGLAVERGAADQTVRQVGPFGAKFSFPRSGSKIFNILP